MKVFKAVGKAISGLAKAVVNIVSGVVKAVVNVVSAVVNFVASPFMGLLGGMGSVPDSGQENARQEGVLIQRQGSRVSIPVIYGYRKVAGSVVFAETGSTNNKYLWVAYAFCEGPVEGIYEAWLDDTQLSAATVQSLNGGNILDVQDGKYKGRVQMQWFPGVYFENPRTSPVGTLSILKDSPSWKSSHVFNGVAVLFVRYEWLNISTQAEADANPFSGNIPNVQLSILGKRVSSLRCTGFDGNNNPTGTAGTENSEYGAAGYQERYSTNPAEILLDYLRNPRYGKGLKNADIDYNSFYVAAQKCNQEINYTSSVKGPILTLNAVLDTNATIFSNVKMLLQNFRGYLPYVQGKYKLKIEDAGNPTNILSGSATIAATFDKNNILGDIQYTAIDRTSKYNYVTVSWVDPDQKFSVQQVTHPADENIRQQYVTLDGGRENGLEVTFSAITNSQMAADMARLLFNKSRFQESCSVTVSAQAFELEPGDNIRIRGNILDFDTTPWRIVNIKLNEDYSFDLSCVRNPDFIYPYVQANTPDVVLPPYVPIGSTIRPPTQPVGQPVGLYPPVSSPLPPNQVQPVNTATNPPPTTAPGVGGGGVGGSTSTQNVTPTPPITPPPPNPLNDFVTIDNAVYTYSGEAVYVDIFFNQPSNAQYKSLLIYYKPAVANETVWKQVESTDRPGSGQQISFKIGPLLANSIYRAYDIITRVTYTTNELSTKIGKFQLLTDGSTRQADPGDSQESIGTGWSLITTPTAGRRDDRFDTIVGIPQLTGGNPTNPRTLNIRVRQDLAYSVANSDIKGIKVYHRQSQETYFAESTIIFSSGSYIPGGNITVSFPGYLGAPGSAQDHDFIFRWIYIDNKESTFQTRYMGAPVESTLGVYSADPFYSILPKKEQSTAYSFSTVAQGIQSGAIGDPKDMTIGVPRVEVVPDGGGSRQLKIWIAPPNVSVRTYWRGTRVLFRPVNPGANPPFQIFDNRSYILNGSVGSLSCNYFTMPITYDQEYQYAFIPFVYDTTTKTTIEGNKAVFGQASVHGTQTRFNYPPDADWGPYFNFQQTTNSEVRGILTTGFAQAEPTIVVSDWGVRNDRTSSYNPYLELVSIPGSFNFHQYYQLEFSKDHIANFSKLIIFRRSRQSSPLAYSPTTNPGSYGFGRWEKIVITSDKFGSGLNYVNLRQPVSHTEFNPSATTTSTQFLAPSQVVGSKPIALCSPNDEFIFVVETSSGVSTKALYYRGNSAPTTTNYYSIKNAVGLPTKIDWPNTGYEPQTNGAGWNKTFGEARFSSNNTTPLAFGLLVFQRNVVPTTNATGTAVVRPIDWVTPFYNTGSLGVL